MKVPASIHVVRTDDVAIDEAARSFENEVLRHAPDVRLTGADDAQVLVLPSAHMSPDVALRWMLATKRRTGRADRFVVYDQRDRPWCWAAGAYTSMPARSFDPRVHRAVPYQWISSDAFRDVRGVQPSLLFSFVGQPSHPCRSDVLALSDPRGHCSTSTASGRDFHDPDFDDRAAWRSSFIELVGNSKFVLCPRGHGTATFRLFETLAAGRVPVIISDDYVLPAGPDWEDCSLRVPEGDAASIPELLRSAEGEWKRMAACAAEAYDLHFSEQTRVRSLLGALLELIESGAPSRVPAKGRRDRRYFSLVARHRVRAVQGRFR